MAEKSIKAKAYKENKFEKTRDHIKLNFMYSEFNTGFRWVLRARCPDVDLNSILVLAKPPI